jgi:hypothetical protein
MLNDALIHFYGINVLIETEGRLSPDGRYKAARHADNYFIVRAVDNSKRDIGIYQSSAGEFYWIGSHHILYIDDFMNQPEVVDVEASLLWGENILEMAGLSAPGSYRIVKVEGQIITVEDTGNGETTNIMYELNSNGEISFSTN